MVARLPRVLLTAAAAGNCVQAWLTCPLAQTGSTAKPWLQRSCAGCCRVATQAATGSPLLLRMGAVAPPAAAAAPAATSAAAAVAAAAGAVARAVLVRLMPCQREVEIVVRLALAAVVGITIGLERRHSHRPAGIRTMALVSLGAATFTIVSSQAFTSGDPGRVAANVASGVGFLGAGTITHPKRRIKGSSDVDADVRGLTTAAAIWIASGLGMSAGAGMYFTAVAGTAITMLVLRMAGLRVRARSKWKHLRLALGMRTPAATTAVPPPQRAQPPAAAVAGIPPAISPQRSSGGSSSGSSHGGGSGGGGSSSGGGGGSGDGSGGSGTISGNSHGGGSRGGGSSSGSGGSGGGSGGSGTIRGGSHSSVQGPRRAVANGTGSGSRRGGRSGGGSDSSRGGSRSSLRGRAAANGSGSRGGSGSGGGVAKTVRAAAAGGRLGGGEVAAEAAAVPADVTAGGRLGGGKVTAEAAAAANAAAEAPVDAAVAAWRAQMQRSPRDLHGREVVEQGGFESDAPPNGANGRNTPLR